MAPTPYHPTADATTYRDLLLFEERLKTNAARLKRTKTRYQSFLALLILVIAVLAAEVLLDLDLLLFDSTLRRFLPAFPYLEIVLLFVAVTTLVLFVATGTYTEKIAYANKYVVHANRSLRSFNMYLNVRGPPLLSTGRAATSPPSSPPPPQRKGRNAAPVPIAPIPPSSNPRGELIFSNRVSAAFREGYERYRNAFERRREERERAAGRPWWRPFGPKTPSTASAGDKEALLGTPSPAPSRRNSPAPDVGSIGPSRGGSVRKRGRGGRSGTPSLSHATGGSKASFSAASSSGAESS